MADTSRRLAAEFVGTAMLLCAVVGSGMMAETLTADVALALLCNAIATGATLFLIITIFAPLSGAHFNPAVTLLAVLDRGIPSGLGIAYVAAQAGGAVLGVLLAHAMFDQPIFAWGIKERTGAPQWLSELVAVFGLILTIEALRARRIEMLAAAVALYIVAAYWFTASTSFANPAVTLARSITPTFSGIRPEDAPAFMLAQLVGALAGWATARVLFRTGDGRAVSSPEG